MVIVVFTAAWDGSFFLFVDSLKSVAGKFQNDVRVRVLDIADHPELAEAFGISEIPTTVFISNREVMHQFPGATSRAKISERIKAIVATVNNGESAAA